MIGRGSWCLWIACLSLSGCTSYKIASPGLEVDLNVRQLGLVLLSPGDQATPTADFVLWNDGKLPLEIDPEQVQATCSGGDCDFLDISWSREERPLVLKPDELAVLHADLAFSAPGTYRVRITVPTTDSDDEGLSLYLCATVHESPCDPASGDCGPFDGYYCSPACFKNVDLECPESGNGECTSGTCPAPIEDGHCWGETLQVAYELGDWQKRNLGCGRLTIGGDPLVNPAPVDSDADGFEDACDNCPRTANRDQADAEGDGTGDACDNCPLTPNDAQRDIDADGIGDLCDADLDGDGVSNELDNCPASGNATQVNLDADLAGDACDADIDGDGVLNIEDNCPFVANPDQLAGDPGRYGDACLSDLDGDGVQDFVDNCRLVSNPDQADLDADGSGDSCDTDIDGDGIRNELDNCGRLYNPHQEDVDRDGVGDVCDGSYCYVVDRVDACLDPGAIFSVYAGADREARVGDRVPLPFWTNRQSRALEYTWTVDLRPTGSTAAIDGPAGTLALSLPFGYPYLKDRAAEFRPDQPGTYTLRLTAKLLFKDHLFPNAQTAAATFSLHVSPQD